MFLEKGEGSYPIDTEYVGVMDHLMVEPIDAGEVDDDLDADPYRSTRHRPGVFSRMRGINYDSSFSIRG